MHYVQFRNQMTNANDEDLMATAKDLYGTASFIVGSGSYSVVQNSPTGMSVLINDGVSYTYSSTLTYHMRTLLNTFALTAAKAVLTIDSNSSGSTRYDLICIRIDTAAISDADASNIATLIVVKGTPGAGVPATPANYYKLAEITVADGATTIGTAQITDSRVENLLATRTGVEILTNKTLTTPIIDKHSGVVTTDTDGATVTMNMATSRHQVILGGNRTLALTNLSTGQVTIADLIQDSTGSRTVTWPSFGATATMTIATPCVVTTSKDIPTLTPVIFTTTGALPTGVVSGTVYYYVRVNATTGNISTSVANAQAGTYIASSGSQSGVHTCAVQIRWPSQTAPTLSTGKFLTDTINFYCKDATNTVVNGVVAIAGV